MALRPFALALLFVSTLSTAAAADTLTVPSDAYPTIQSAIDDAAAGDKVVVKPGVYREALVIPGDKEGLELTGSKQTIVIAPLPDPENPDPGVTSDDGLWIQASGVTVRNLTFSHAVGRGVYAGVPEGIGFGGPTLLDSVTVDRVTVVNAAEAGIFLVSNDATVSGCTVLGCAGGVLVRGDDARIDKTRVERDRDDGIIVDGDRSVVERCTVRTIDNGCGVSIDGEGAVVARNTLENLRQDGILTQGSTTEDTHLIERNRIADVGNEGIVADGDGVRILRNVINGSARSAVSAFGDGVVVSGNRIDRVFEDGEGVLLFGDDGVVEGNRVADVIGFGVWISGEGIRVAKNTVQRCGTADRAGMRISGSLHRVESNRVSDCARTGIRVDGDSNELVKNRATGCTDDGIRLLDGADNVLDGNTASGNRGDGIENLSDDTVIRKNRSSGNLQDLSNATDSGAEYVDEGGNVFKTGGLTVEPIVAAET